MFAYVVLIWSRQGKHVDCALQAVHYAPSQQDLTAWQLHSHCQQACLALRALTALAVSVKREGRAKTPLMLPGGMYPGSIIDLPTVSLSLVATLVLAQKYMELLWQDEKSRRATSSSAGQCLHPCACLWGLMVRTNARLRLCGQHHFHNLLLY